jgi:hypothetical protein
MPQEEDAFSERATDADEPGSEDESSGPTKPSMSPGSAIAVQAGSLEPTFDQFESFLLRNARVHHFQEWWEQYVEQAVLGADFATYREVMFLVGSLLRRLGRKKIDVESDRRRERYMWTRIKEKLAEKQIRPADAMYICGAIHGVSDIEEFGTSNDLRWTIPPRTETRWLYGLIPSSHASIERQFGHPPGTVSIAEATWSKAMQALKLKPFKIPRPKGSPATAAETETIVDTVGIDLVSTAQVNASLAIVPDESEGVTIEHASTDGIASFFSRPPALIQQDEEQLLRWCIDVVALARKNGYLSSTADAIAVYQTTKLLAGLRNRRHPTPYDFQDAAITCIEKDRVPGKRDVRRLCEILLGGDRLGLVGYSSLPRLAQDIYDRLKPLSLKMTSTIERALMDFKRRPELLPCSDLLWMLHFLLGDIARPIMGERKLGEVPIQESWDLAIGRNQRALVELAYEGVVIEHVLEKRLKAKVNASAATTVVALAACEDSLLYLKSARLTGELGERALSLLEQETSAKDAPEVFDRVRRLVAYYRSTRSGLPPWIKRFVVTGYTHYTSLLPEAFADRGTRPEQISAMLAFLFTLEGLALSLGCSRSQLVIAIGQAGPRTEDPAKIGLLWAAEWLLGLREIGEIRSYLDQVLANPLMLPAFPGYVSGFLLALTFTPLVGRLVVELLSKAFERLPDDVMMPWLPGLIVMLRPHAADLLPGLVKEASQCFPRDLGELRSGWVPPWEIPDETPADEIAPATNESANATGAPAATSADPDLDESHAATRAMLFANRGAIDAIAERLGAERAWVEASTSAGGSRGAATTSAVTLEASSGAGAAPTAASPASELLRDFPATLEALAKLL